MIEARRYADQAISLLESTYRERQSFYVAHTAAFLLLQLRELYALLGDDNHYERCLQSVLEAACLMQQRKNGLEARQMLLAAHLLIAEFCGCQGQLEQMHEQYAKAKEYSIEGR